MLARASLLIALSGLLVAVASWFILVLTVVATVPAGNTVWVAQRVAWVQGQAPADSVALISSQPVTNGLAQRVGELVGGYPDAAVVQILARHGDQVLTDVVGELLINGQRTGLVLDEPVAPKTLSSEYLTLCLDGACAPATASTVPVDRVLGKVLGGMSLSGPAQVPIGQDVNR
jgi:hypothetical protein